jgi:acyl-CoA dehydrogenase
LGDGLAVVAALAREAAADPLAETAVLGGWLLSTTGIDAPGVPSTVAANPRDQVALRRAAGGWRLSCRMHRVPWAREAGRIVALAPAPDGEGGWMVVGVPRRHVEIGEGRNLADEPRDQVLGADVPVEDEWVRPLPSHLGPADLLRRGALVRAVQLAAAAERAAELTITHANRRHQFGRPVAAFQAVQQRMVGIASEAALASMAAAVAVAAAEQGPAVVEVAAAKAVTSGAAGVVAGHAHQVHGAVGMTLECDLQRFTRRLWSWRREFGSERYWCARLGGDLAAGGAGRLWPTLATR